MDNRELLEKKVYTLIGEDVADVLEKRGLEHILEDEEEFESLLNYIKDKLIIPWSDYIGATIEMYLIRTKLPL